MEKQKVVLLHNHEEFEGWEVVKVVLIPENKLFDNLLREYLQQYYNLYEKKIVRESDNRVFYSYYWLSDDMLEKNKFLQPLRKVPKHAISKERLTTRGINIEHLCAYLLLNGCTILDPIYAP